MNKTVPKLKFVYEVTVNFFSGNRLVFHECKNCEATDNFTNVIYINKQGETVTEAFHNSTVRHVTIVAKEIST